MIMAEPLIAAYYLPQFYPVPLNSRWWGEGFTEWNAVLKAQRGWRSPARSLITPSELGFYDLRSSETRRRQGELARDHGIDAFAIYHYYSAGERVLSEVVDAALDDGQPSLPFFLCWANHDWTLAWQGRPDKTIWAQRYTELRDDSHIDWLLTVFEDERYLKVGGKPVLQIYDIAGLPEPARLLEKWRSRSLARGFPGLYLLGVAPSRNEMSAADYGLDGWVQGAGPALQRLRRHERIFPALASPAALVRFLRFRDTPVPRRQLAGAFKAWREDFPEPVSPMVIASWNNTGRRSLRAWHMDADPTGFEDELRQVIACIRADQAQDEDHPTFVFINAWNEWGETMSVEPSVEHGRAFLEAIKRARQ